MWRHRPREIIANTIRDRLKETPLVSERMKVEFQALQFDADCCRGVSDRDRSEVWVSRLRAERGEFLVHVFNDKRRLGRRIKELENVLGDIRHWFRVRRS